MAVRCLAEWPGHCARLEISVIYCTFESMPHRDGELVSEAAHGHSFPCHRFLRIFFTVLVDRCVLFAISLLE